MKSYKDQEILDGIKKNDHKVVNYIYRTAFPKINNLIVNSGGSADHAKDIFQDAMVVVWRKIDADNFTLKSKFTTYLYSICRNLWFQELKYGDRVLSKAIRNLDEVNEPEDNSKYKNEMYEIFDKHIKDLSPDCQKILSLHFQNYSIDEIKRFMEYKNKHYTIDRKYRCKQSLVKRIINDPRYIEISNGLKNKS